MLKCKICGASISATKSRHYISRDIEKTGLAATFGSFDEPKIYDSFDCPFCGCQIIAQERKRKFDVSETE